MQQFLTFTLNKRLLMNNADKIYDISNNEANRFFCCYLFYFIDSCNKCVFGELQHSVH